jgi:hypothetical protein
MGSLFQGSINAWKNPKDIKGHATGGYSNTKKIDAERNKPATPSTPQAGTPMYAVPKSFEEEEKEKRLKASALLSEEGQSLKL